MKKIQESIDLINNIYESQKGIKLYALFSGGHDSLVSTHLASQSKYFSGVIHIDTGIGIPQTQEYVIKTCQDFKWELKISRATENEKKDGTPDPQIYEEYVMRYGFPGAAQHSAMYRRLKERPLRTILRKIKKTIPDWDARKNRIILSTGIRLDESKRREKNPLYQTDFNKKGAQIWISPIRQWSEDDCEEYIERNNLPKNPVKNALCMSGECCCGSFAKPNELAQIEFFYPETGKRIRELEDKVRSKFDWGWEENSPRRKQKKEQKEKQKQQMCWSCNQLSIFEDIN